MEPRFLAWNVATALSILGFVSPGCSEVRLIRPEFTQLFAHTQMMFIIYGVDADLLSEWPEVQSKASAAEGHRIDISVSFIQRKYWKFCGVSGGNAEIHASVQRLQRIFYGSTRE